VTGITVGYCDTGTTLWASFQSPSPCSALSTYNIGNIDSYFIKVYCIFKSLFIHQSQMNRQTDIHTDICTKLTKDNKQAIRISVTQ